MAVCPYLGGQPGEDIWGNGDSVLVCRVDMAAEAEGVEGRWGAWCGRRVCSWPGEEGKPYLECSDLPLDSCPVKE